MPDSKMGFTPGPWSIRHHKKLDPAWADRPRNVLDSQGRILVTWVDTGGVSWQAGGEKRANAHLIAAAPDLYAALESVQRCAEGSGPFEIADLNRQVLAALAKARGETA